MHKITFCFMLVAILIALPIDAINTNATELDNLVIQWTQLEQQHSEIDNHWRENKPLLEQQLLLLKEERIQLQGILNQHATANDEVEKERFDLLQQQTQMEENQQLMESELNKVSSIVISMYSQLPPPLKEKWGADIAILSGGNKLSTGTAAVVENNVPHQTNTLLNNSERLDKLLGLFNHITQFEQRVALHQTTMQVSETTEIQVDQVYLGLSQGWYISKDGQYWGTGNSTVQGWQWQHQNPEVDIFKLRQTVQMLTEPVVATLVTLPIKLSAKQEPVK